MLTRDFASLSADATSDLFKLCLQNLILFLPLFSTWQTTMNQEAFDQLDETLLFGAWPKHHDQDQDFEQFAHNMTAYVAQLINLLQTVVGKAGDINSLLAGIIPGD